MRDRTPRPLLAALLLIALTAAFLGAWWAATDGYECESVAVFDCTGPVLLVTVLGIPGWMVGVAISLRWSGAASGLLGLCCLIFALVGLVMATEEPAEQ